MHAASRVYGGGNSIICDTHNPTTILYGPHPRNQEMLMPGGRFAKPTIV